ncbi:MAG: hypothetical protein AB7O73_12920 [Bacteroidia bacterium]
MKEEILNPEESLQIINQVINRAKNRIADDGVLFIFWGWLVIVASMINYFTVKTGYDYGYLAWIILMPLGGIYSAIYGYKQKKKSQSNSYVGMYLGYLWTAFGIALLISLIFMYPHGVKTTYFFLMLLYGIATMVSGGLLQFKPLVFGGVFSFVCAVASVFVPDLEQLLIIALAIFGSYVVPGHLLRSKYKSQNV